MKKKPSSSRLLAVRLKSPGKRSTSSQRWLTRQLNDPYVHKAKEEGYRSRAAYKLIEIDDKFKFLKPGHTVVDLGAAPGGWAQVACERVGKGHVIGIDLHPILPLPGATFICADFTDCKSREMFATLLPNPPSVVLSDMAPPSTGHAQTDHLRIMFLAEEAFLFAQEWLSPKGTFVAKVLRGGTEKEMLNLLKHSFEKVVHFKPSASRKESSEMYVIGLGFRKRSP